MLKFPAVTYSLKDLGEEYKDCYLSFQSLSYGELKGLAKLKDGDESKLNEEGVKLIDKIFDKFVSGKTLDDKGNLVDVKKEDLQHFPLSIVKNIADFLALTPENLTKSE